MAETYRLYGRLYSHKLKQAIHEPSATKKYEYGTLLEDSMGNKYRYAKTEDSSVYTSRGAWSYNYQITGHIAVPTTAAIGASVIYGTVGASEGIAGNGVVAANYLRDGHVAIWHAAATSVTVHRIVSNTATSGGGTIALTLAEPIKLAVTASVETIEIMSNPYIDVRTGNSNGIHAFVGQWKSEVVTAYPYGWLLTHGPTFIDPQQWATTMPGITHKALVGFRHDGSIDTYLSSDTYRATMQYAGHVLSYTAAGTQAAPFIMLDLE